MRKMIALTNTNGRKEGEIFFISNNEAHRLIEENSAKIFDYNDKMLRPKKKGYKIK